LEAARKVRQKHFVLDGEAVVLGTDGVSDFNALHSHKHDHEVHFCALIFSPMSRRRPPHAPYVDEEGELGAPAGAPS
jgi:hypothetical protein